MSSANLRLVGVACLIACGVCLFVAVERYKANADNVAAMKELSRGVLGPPSGSLLGDMEPATPTATKYALVFALITGVGGIVAIVKSRKAPGDDQG